MSSKTFSSEDIYIFRLRKITEVVSTRIVHQVFYEGTKRRRKGEQLLDFYQNKGVNIYKFQKSLNKGQIEKLKADPDGKTFDITLLYYCIQWGGDGVAPKNNPCWTGSDVCLESFLTAVKNERNKLNHGDTTYTKDEFVSKTDEIRMLLTETLQLAKIKYGIEELTINSMVNDLNDDINRFRDNPLVPLSVIDYKNQIFFLEQSRHVRIQGKKLLGEAYAGWVFVLPVSFLVELDFQVDIIYTDMVLLSISEQKFDIPQEYKDLLAETNFDIKDPIVLIEGIAGVGKTTLTKKILLDWSSGHSTMRNLTNHDLLLYVECRNSTIKSFRDLIRSWMPELAKHFQGDDFLHVVLDQKLIVIVDGLDELNSSSKSLFKELLDLKAAYGLTIMVTTRPERLDTYQLMVNFHQIKTKRIRLTGISIERRSEFVTKYHSAIKNKRSYDLTIDGLLMYLKKTKLRLDTLWQLPYNLTLVTILWTEDPHTVTMITTEAELYSEIHKLHCNKLRRRLLDTDTTMCDMSSLREKIDHVIAGICYEALISLKEDEIYISSDSINRLQVLCRSQDLPEKEMMGAFLKHVEIRTPDGTRTKHSFPHKGLQEFLGAHCLLKEDCESLDPEEERICKQFEGVIKINNLPAETGLEIMSFIREKLNKHFHPLDSTPISNSAEESGVVRKRLAEVEKKAFSDFKKYQNLLIMSLGILYLKKDQTNYNTMAEEVLVLLKEAGINNTYGWLRVLGNVKCDKFVAKFISQQPGLLEGDLNINDSNIFSYISLLAELQEIPKSGKNNARIEIQIADDTTGVDELLKAINRLCLCVIELSINKDVQLRQTKISYGPAISEILTRCEVEIYRGMLLPYMSIPSSIRKLYVNVVDAQCYAPLQAFLEKPHPDLNALCVCFNPQIDVGILQPLPCGWPYFPDVRSQDFPHVSEMIKKLYPIDGPEWSLPIEIVFPSPKFSHEDTMDLLNYIPTLREEYSVQLSRTVKPSPEETKKLKLSLKEIGVRLKWDREDRLWPTL